SRTFPIATDAFDPNGVARSGETVPPYAPPHSQWPWVVSCGKNLAGTNRRAARKPMLYMWYYFSCSPSLLRLNALLCRTQVSHTIIVLLHDSFTIIRCHQSVQSGTCGEVAGFAANSPANLRVFQGIPSGVDDDIGRKLTVVFLIADDMPHDSHSIFEKNISGRRKSYRQIQ